VLEAALLAGIIYMSSSGIVTKALIDLRRIVNPETEVILGIMVFEDLFIALFLAVISGAALAGAAEPSIGASVLKAAVFCAAFLIVAKKYSNIVDRAINIKSDEIFLLFLFSSAVLVSAIAQRIGVSGAIGAFFLGLTFSETQHVQRIERKIVPLRDLFASMFFFSFGMLINVSAFPQVFAIAIVIIPLIVLSKAISGYFAARAQNFSAKTSLFVGFSTIPRGEFSVVLASLGAAAGATPLLYPLTAIIVLVTSTLGILLMSTSDAVYGVLAKA